MALPYMMCVLCCVAGGMLADLTPGTEAEAGDGHRQSALAAQSVALCLGSTIFLLLVLKTRHILHITI